MVVTTQNEIYDVVIMGAGFAGVCQARHLLLNVPNIKIALIDPKPEQRTEKDLKIGESTEMVYKYLTRNISDNSEIEKTRQEFTHYRYRAKLNPWLTEATPKSSEKVPVNV